MEYLLFCRPEGNFFILPLYLKCQLVYGTKFSFGRETKIQLINFNFVLNFFLYIYIYIYVITFTFFNNTRYQLRIKKDYPNEFLSPKSGHIIKCKSLAYLA